MNPAQLLAHFDRISEAPDAVPRLRRFILDLAVRGTLVEQDPNDEPASNLLKRIEREKLRLVASGEIRNTVAIERADGGLAFPLPRGWEASHLGSLARKLGAGSTPLGGKTVYQAEGVPFIRSQNVRDNGLRLNEVARISRAVHDRMSGTHVQQGDILLNITGASIGRCALVQDGLAEANVSQHVAIIRLFVPTIRDFIHLALTAPIYQRLIDDVQVGVSRAGLSMQRLALFVMPVPPLAEQHRIVGKVDELMALCDRLEAAQTGRETRRDGVVAASLNRLSEPAADGNQPFRDHARFHLRHLPRLTTRPEHIQQLRHTILNLAVRGRVVAQDLHDEPAGQLHDRLRVALASGPGNTQARARRKLLPAASTFFGEGTFPGSWALTNFDSVNAIVSGVAKGKDLRGVKTASYPYLRVANVQRGHLDLRIVKELAIRADEIDRYRLHKGDVLMTEGGDWDKLGRAAIWNDEIPDCIHQNHIYRIRPANSDDLLPEWVMLFANSPLGRSYFEGASKQTTNLASINMTQLRSCPLPLPPRAEQHRIVAKVDELMAICDQLEAQLTTAQAESRRLLEAVLQQALSPVA